MAIVNIVVGIVSVLVTSGVFSILLFYRENKEAKSLSNDNLVIEQWKELYEKAKAEKEGYKKDFDEDRRENKILRDQNNDLTTENAVLKMQKCEVRGCTLRKPPSGY